MLERSAWLKLWVLQLFKTLAGMRPEHRLARNLKAAVTQLADDSELIFSEHERNVLTRLDSAGVSTEHKEVAQALLNVYERYQLTQALTPLFKHARSRCTRG